MKSNSALNLIVTVLVVLSCVGCNKINNLEPDGNKKKTFDDLFSPPSYDESGRFQAICSKGFVVNGVSGAALVYKIYGFANISPGSDTTISVGLMKMSDGYLLPDTSAALRYHWEGTDTTGIGGPAFGTTTNWGIGGNSTYGIPAFSTTMYVPAILTCSTSAASVSKQNTHSFTWNTDGSNSLGIFIKLVYINHSNGNITQWDSSVVDNGSCTIPSSALQLFPNNSDVTLAVGRGNYKVDSDTTNRDYLMLGGATCYQDLKILP